MISKYVKILDLTGTQAAAYDILDNCNRLNWHGSLVSVFGLSAYAAGLNQALQWQK